MKDGSEDAASFTIRRCRRRFTLSDDGKVLVTHRQTTLLATGATIFGTVHVYDSIWGRSACADRSAALAGQPVPPLPESAAAERYNTHALILKNVPMLLVMDPPKPSITHHRADRKIHLAGFSIILQQLIDVLRHKTPAAEIGSLDGYQRPAGGAECRPLPGNGILDSIRARQTGSRWRSWAMFTLAWMRQPTNAGELDYAQRHLRILSGLYGVLRPLDLMQPYRLEMGTRLANPRGKDLYSFWAISLLRL